MESNKRTLLFILGLIPLMLVLLLCGQFIELCLDFSLTNFFLFAGYLYLLPPFMWRILSPLLPAQLGASKIYEEETVNGWLLSYQLQQLYNALPVIENILKLIPGAYSSWLRLWGAEIGEKVKWSMNASIIDRPFIKIENECEVKENFCSHTLKQGLLNLTIVNVKKF